MCHLVQPEEERWCRHRKQDKKLLTFLHFYCALNNVKSETLVPVTVNKLLTKDLLTYQALPLQYNGQVKHMIKAIKLNNCTRH